MKDKKLVPYSVYLPVEYYNKIRKLAKERKASSTVRDAIMMSLDGGDVYNSAYNQGLRDAIKVINKSKQLEMISFKGKDMTEILAKDIMKMERK